MLVDGHGIIEVRKTARVKINSPASLFFSVNNEYPSSLLQLPLVQQIPLEDIALGPPHTADFCL